MDPPPLQGQKSFLRRLDNALQFLAYQEGNADNWITYFKSLAGTEQPFRIVVVTPRDDASGRTICTISKVKREGLRLGLETRTIKAPTFTQSMRCFSCLNFARPHRNMLVKEVLMASGIFLLATNCGSERCLRAMDFIDQKVPDEGTCARCYRRAEAPKKCTHCKVAYYCNQTCQREDWGIHKKLCDDLRIRRKEKTPFFTFTKET